MPLSTRSDVSSDNTLTGRSPSRSDESGQGHDEGLDNKRPGRKTPTDLLVEEIMGEGMILSPFNSGKYFNNNILKDTHIFLLISLFCQCRDTNTM